MFQREFDKELSSLCGGDIKGKKFLLAVSGGMDSMSMASLFLKSSLDPLFSIANVNFSLRGKESELDQKLVLDWSSKHNIQAHSIVFDTHKYAEEHSISTEMAARDLRYNWFYQLMEEYGYDFLVIAHNKNDSVETLFLNILRGTGIKGLVGIKNRSQKMIRPLLPFSREQIKEYVLLKGVPYRDDATNFEPVFSRNRIRNIVFPEFRKINPSFIDTVYRSTKYISDSADILEELLLSKSGTLYRKNSDGNLIIDIDLLIKEKHPSFFLFALLEEYGFNSSQILSISNTIAGQSGKRFFSEGYELLIGRGVIEVFPIVSQNDLIVEITGPGSYSFGSYSIKIDILESKEITTLIPPFGVLYLDADKLSFPLVCRKWNEGDRFRPFGMKMGSKKLSDFYTDLKLDLKEKETQPVVSSMDNIVCLPGLRIDDRYSITTSTKFIVKVEIDK